MATNDQKSIVSNQLITLAGHVRRGTTASYIAILRAQSPDFLRELALALIDVQLGSVIGLCQDVICDQLAADQPEPEPVFSEGRIESLDESSSETTSSPAD